MIINFKICFTLLKILLCHFLFYQMHNNIIVNRVTLKFKDNVKFLSDYSLEQHDNQEYISTNHQIMKNNVVYPLVHPKLYSNQK